MIKFLQNWFGGDSKNRIPTFRSWDAIQQGLTDVLCRTTQARLFELLIMEGMPRSGAGSLNQEEAKQFQRCVDASLQGKTVCAKDFPRVADGEAQRRIGKWLTNMSRPDIACAPHNLAELGPVALLADKATNAHVQTIYGCYVRMIFGINSQDAVSDRVTDLREFQRSRNLSMWGELWPFLGSRVIVVVGQPLEFENVSILPNLILSFLQDHTLVMMHSPDRDLTLLRKTGLEGQFYIDHPMDIDRTSMRVATSGGTVESLWLP